MSIDEKSLKDLVRGSSVRRGRAGVSGNADKCLVHTGRREGGRAYDYEHTEAL